jgi:GNAT superfamily N-acetyltransferase
MASSKPALLESAPSGLSDPQDYRWCHLRFSERWVPLANDEPSRFLQEYVGRIEWEDPENSSIRVSIGSFRAFLVDLVGAITEDESVYQVFDTTQSTWSVFEALFDIDTEELTDATKKAAFGNDYPLNHGAFIIDRVVVLPEHRGHCVGLLAMKALIEEFRQASGLVVIKPFPLQFESESPSPSQCPPDDWPPNSDLELEGYSQSMRAALSKLKQYYSRLGFKPVRGTDYMVLDPARDFGDYDDLLEVQPRVR